MMKGAETGPSRPILVTWARPASSGGNPELAARVLAPLALALLSDPTEESLGRLAVCDSPPFPGPFNSEVEAVARAAASTDLLGARVEFTRLFHSPRGAVCPPWECVALDTAPHLMGPRHESVLRAFRRAGLEPAGSGGESADHIGLEIAFLGLLAERMCAGEDLSGPFEEFWIDHVVPWMPDFASRLESEARLPYLRAVGVLLRQAVTVTQPE
jgi:TorA maturation chaperone TorD